MNNANEKAIAIIRNKGGLIRTQEALNEGIHRRTLYRLAREGTLLSISRGLYQLAGLEIPAQAGLAEVSKAAPHGVICLVSALAFHGLTTQNPQQVWLAVDRKSRRPRIDYPPLKVFHFSGAVFREGVELHLIMGQQVKIYNAPKTVIDCFRLVREVGLDVALEGAREYLKKKEASPEMLMTYAKLNRSEKLIVPYLQALIG